MYELLWSVILVIISPVATQVQTLFYIYIYNLAPHNFLDLNFQHEYPYCSCRAYSVRDFFNGFMQVCGITISNLHWSCHRLALSHQSLIFGQGILMNPVWQLKMITGVVNYDRNGWMVTYGWVDPLISWSDIGHSKIIWLTWMVQWSSYKMDNFLENTHYHSQKLMI